MQRNRFSMLAAACVALAATTLPGPAGAADEPASRIAAGVLAGATDDDAHVAPRGEPPVISLTIPAGDHELAGTLRLPAAEGGPFPAAVLVHGSGCSTREGLGSFESLCLEAGVAALAFDQQGCGDSTGTFRGFTVENSAELFAELAVDVRHAMDLLAARPEVDVERLGLVGGSQAGWIMPLAADTDPRVAFMVVAGGCAVSVGEEAFHGSLTGEGSRLGISIAKADKRLRRYDGPRGFDPRPVLARVTAPSLWLFGRRDDVIPVQPSIDAIKEARIAGRVNHEVHIFPYGDHDMLDRRTGEPVPADQVVKDWLRKRRIIR